MSSSAAATAPRTSRATKAAAPKAPRKACKNGAAAAVADSRYPREKARWLKRDEKALLAGMDAGMDVRDLSLLLERSPPSVLDRLNALGQFCFEPGSEEEAELFGLALAGVPLREVVLWCAADVRRLPFAEIDAMRKSADLRGAFILAREASLCDVRAASSEDLQWLASAPEAAVRAATRRLAVRSVAPSCAAVRREVESPAVIAADTSALVADIPNDYFLAIARRHARRGNASTSMPADGLTEDGLSPGPAWFASAGSGRGKKKASTARRRKTSSASSGGKRKKSAKFWAIYWAKKKTAAKSAHR